MTALGIALVVMVLFVLLGFVAGLRATITRAGTPGNWIVLNRGISNEPGSYITVEQYNIVRARPEIVTDTSGAPLISPEIVTGFDARPPVGQMFETFLRGVYPIAYRVHRGIRIVSGRFPAPGKAEMMIGRSLLARFPYLAPPHRMRFGRRMWTIVGVFSDNGSARESEIWTNLDVLQQDYRNGNGFNTLHVTIRPGMGASFAAALRRDARTSLVAIPETKFYRQQSDLADKLRALGVVIAAILGIGATFGGMNTMFAAVARRSREVGVLRALGFGRASILLSFVAESMIIALVGGAVGEALGVAVSYGTGLQSRLMNIGTFIFTFRLNTFAFVAGLVAALAIGALGGLVPAWRAARIGVIDSLRTM
jgi:putative ABC transport system permease protein